MKAWRGSVGPQVIFALAAGLIASVIAALLTRPWAAGAVGFDSAASVLYFERITAGVRLEAFLGATPKPALTLLFGAVHAVTGDWRAIAALTVATYGLAIASGTLLVARVAGSAAAAFAFVMLLGARLLLEDVSLSYATPLGLWLLTIAGLALARPRPAYRVAAVALLLAPLTRFETIVLPMSAAIFVVVPLFETIADLRAAGGVCGLGADCEVWPPPVASRPRATRASPQRHSAMRNRPSRASCASGVVPCCSTRWR